MKHLVPGWTAPLALALAIGCDSDGSSSDSPDAGDGSGSQTDASTVIDAASASPRVAVSFDDGTFGPLVRSFGPNDNPAQANSAYTVEVRQGRAHYIAPAAMPGPRLTGFLDLPPSLVPIDTPLVVELTFPVASQLTSLGGPTATPLAIAGYYIRGALNNGVPDWVGGGFGDYWFGYVSVGGARLSAIRQGNVQLVSEPFTATTSVTYRVEKSGLEMRLFASYDGAAFHQVGAPVTIALNAGGSAGVAMTHLRVLDTSGAAIDVMADDLRWFY